MIDQYRTALEKRIEARKVYLNVKGNVITAYRESDFKAIVTVDGKEITLGEDDNVLINGSERKVW